jgi:endonuclease V-like protein UPF0215 family
VKREIRVLGIAVTKILSMYNIVGVVFRGKLYLDGVIRTQATKPDLTDSIAEMIMESSHYQQIRIILLQYSLLGKRAIIGLKRLSMLVGKPVIMIYDKKTIPQKQLSQDVEEVKLKLGGNLIRVFLAGVSPKVAERAIYIATHKETVPEVLRVVGIITSSLVEMSIHNF